jgi:preprotein translocase subunit YajC
MFILAQAAGPGSGSGGLQSILMQFWWVLPFFAIFYILLFRPQRVKEKQRQEMLRTLGKNDRVVTIGGLHGVVKSVSENEVTLLVDEKNNLTMKFNRSAVANILNRDEQGELSKEEK